MERLIKIIMITGLFLVCGCPMDSGYAIRIRNSSVQDIYVYGKYQYPDTALSNKKPPFVTVRAKKSNTLQDYSVDDPELERLAYEKLTIFFISKDTVDKYSWDKVRDDYKILKRKEIMKSDLIDGAVYYP